MQERLDRGLATQTWIYMFLDAVVKVVEVSTSHHLPLFLELNKKVYMLKVKRFLFERRVLQFGQGLSGRRKSCIDYKKNNFVLYEVR